MSLLRPRSTRDRLRLVLIYRLGWFVLASLFLPLGAGVSFAQKPIPIAALKRETPVSFEREVLPILRKNCLACHNSSEANGELELETVQKILAGGDSGPAVVPKNGAGSLLLKVASHQIELKMPPEKNEVNARPLTSAELGILKLWIDQGAIGSASGSVLSPRNWRPLPDRINPVYSVAVTPDGKFAACGRANQIFIYHVASGQLVTRLTDPQLQVVSADKRPGIAHRDLVHALAFNRDGDLLASGGFRVVKLWRRPRDVRRLNLKAPAAVAVVAVSPDGTTLATGAADNVIRLLDLAAGKPAAELTGHTAAITDLRFSADGATLISSSEDKTIRVWNLSNGELKGRIDASVAIQAITLVDGGKLLASGGEDNFIRRWIVPTELSQRLENVPEATTTLAVTSDRTHLAAANAAGEVAVIDLASGKLVRKWQAHDGAVNGLAFHSRIKPEPKEKSKPKPKQGEKEKEKKPEKEITLATVGDDGTVRLWDAVTGKPKATLRGSLSPVNAVVFHPLGQQLLAGAADGPVTLWNLNPVETQLLASKAESPAGVATLSPDGKLLATTGTTDQRPAIIIYELATGKILYTFLGHQGPITALRFSADSRRLASGSADATARLWNLDDGKFPQQMQFTGHEKTVTSVAFNSTATQILSGSADHTVKLWNAADGKELKDFTGLTASVVSVAMAPNNAMIFAASADKTIRFWNAADGKQVRTLVGLDVITAMSLSRNGSQLAAAFADGSIGLYQTSDGKLLHTLKGHQTAVKSLAFSPDSARLVSAAADKRAIVWDVAAGRLLEIIPVETGVAAVTYGSTADRIVIGAGDGSLRIHPLRFGRALGNLTKPVVAVAMNANGQFAYVACADGTLRRFTTSNGQPGFVANHGAPIHDMVLSPNGQMLATAGEDKSLKIWNVGNGAPLGPKPQLTGFTDAVHSVAFSPDGTRLIGGGAAAETLVFNVGARELEHSFIGHAGAVKSMIGFGEKADFVISASADKTVLRWRLLARGRIAGHGKPVTSLATVPTESDKPAQILSGSEDNTLRHWNFTTGQLLRQMNHGAPVAAVAVRPDGQRFASAAANNTAKLWNAANGQQLAELKGDIRARTLTAKFTQELALATNKVKSSVAAYAAAMTAAPLKAAAAKTATAALGTANTAVTQAEAALKKSEVGKTAAEKTAIEAAALAQKAAKAKAQADSLTATTAAAAKKFSDKAARAKARAAAAPKDKGLADAAVAANKLAAETAAAAKKAVDMAAVATKLAVGETAKANTAAMNSVAASKPYVAALLALSQAKALQNQTSAASAIATREAKFAAEAIPLTKTRMDAAAVRLNRVQADLDAAAKAMAAAEQPIRAVAFSRDNQLLATGGDFPALHTWDATNGAAVASFRGHADKVVALTFTPGGELVSGSLDESVCVWNPNPGWILERTIGRVDDPALLINRVVSLDFSADGSRLVTGGGDPSRGGEIKIWNVSDGSLARAIPEPHADCVFGVAFSRDGRLIASGGADKYVRIFEANTGKLLRSLEGHTEHVLSVSWHSDGNKLASSGADNVIKVWNPQTGDILRTIVGFTKQVTSVRFIGESNKVVSSSGDARVRIVGTGGVNTGAAVVRTNFAGLSQFMYCATATPDGRFVLASGHDSVLRIWNGTNGAVLHALKPPRTKTDDSAAELKAEKP